MKIDSGKLYMILEKINVLNYDNGKHFRRTDRLDAIMELLWKSDYRRVNAEGLFHLYAKEPISKLPDEIVVISSHIDCSPYITRCFTERYDQEYWLGTFDNSLTNAAILYLMLENLLPERAVVAFTGDEEDNSKGAKQVSRFFQNRNKKIKVIILDVTDMGRDQGCDFTVENNFWSEETGRAVVNTITNSGNSWKFVPSYLDCIPDYVPLENLIHQEAEADESWEYDEKKEDCFSLCVPVEGDMHSCQGVQARVKSICHYVDILRMIINEISKSD